MLMRETIACIDGGPEEYKHLECIHTALADRLQKLAETVDLYNERKNGVDSTKFEAERYPFTIFEPILVFKGWVDAEESYGPGYLNMIRNETFFVTTLGSWKKEAGYYYRLKAIVPMSAW